MKKDLKSFIESDPESRQSMDMFCEVLTNLIKQDYEEKIEAQKKSTT